MLEQETNNVNNVNKFIQTNGWSGVSTLPYVHYNATPTTIEKINLLTGLLNSPLSKSLRKDIELLITGIVSSW